MRRGSTLTVLVLGLALLLSAAPAAAYTVSYSFGNRAATAAFTVTGSGQLQIVLTNSSAADVLVPVDVLTALFFTLTNAGSLTSVSAILTTGSTVFFDADGQPAGGVVGGEWAYGCKGCTGDWTASENGPGGATQGISSSGFGLFGGATFPGANLDPPPAIDGLNYGLTSAGDNTASGNTPVTGGVPLVKNSVTFVLSSSLLGGLPANFDFATNLSNVNFQYGTALTEFNSGCIGPQCFPTVPEPSTLALLGLGLAGLAGGACRLRESRRR